ncbi:MAG: hypothetical protein ABJL11_00010 [Parasphingorhabdus sp.]
MKNSFRLGALIFLYSLLLLLFDLLASGFVGLICSAVLLWILYLLRRNKPLDSLEPMILPASLICSSISIFALLRFSAQIDSNLAEAAALVALATAFLFAIYRSFFPSRE